MKLFQKLPVPLSHMEEIEDLIIGGETGATLNFPQWFSDEEIAYADRATIMPFLLMREYIIRYDYVKPKIDELKLMHELKTRFNCEEDWIALRWKEVRVLLAHDYSHGRISFDHKHDTIGWKANEATK